MMRLLPARNPLNVPVTQGVMGPRLCAKTMQVQMLSASAMTAPMPNTSTARATGS